MKKKSTKKSGFTLLETIISMTVTMILIVGVFNAYIMLIRNTKDGEVKQKAALVGKKVIEEIRNGQIDPNDTTEINFDRDGNITSENSAYIAKISEEPQNISIGDGNKENVYYISDEKIIDNENEIKKNKYKVTEKTILIRLNEIRDMSREDSRQQIGSIKFEDSLNENTIYDEYSIWLNLKYLTEDSDITIKVDNESDRNVNLYILTSDKKPKIQVINSEGSVNTAYKSSDYNISEKSGDLYKITVKVDGKFSSGELEENLFSADILKNMN